MAATFNFPHWERIIADTTELIKMHSSRAPVKAKLAQGKEDGSVVWAQATCLKRTGFVTHFS